MPYNTVLLWLRRTLRLDDNRALHAALQSARRVVPVFVLDPSLLEAPQTSPRRIAFLYESLRALDEALRERGSALVVRQGDPSKVLPALVAELGAEALFHSREYEPWGRARDAAVQTALPVPVEVFPDHLLVEPEALLSKAGTPYTVFTPYYRRWQMELFLAPQAAPLRLPPVPPVASLPLPASAFPREESGAAVLERFLQSAIHHYTTGRDFPGDEATSRLSPHLKFGTISVRRVREAAVQLRQSLPVDQRQGIDSWVRQLAWRDFYYQILYHFPRVATGAFKPAYDRIRWENDPELLAAWQRGETGYPFVDAGMRELYQTGWMHNRARMVVASFLTKDLLCDWRLGEQWFLQHLRDGDQAANNGGWQWAAGTGTDAQPYFRIFHPVAQGEKFDPDGSYVRRWCPELKPIPVKYIHKPWGVPAAEQQHLGCVVGRDYPERIVDHAQQRARALTLYRSAIQGVA